MRSAGKKKRNVVRIVIETTRGERRKFKTIAASEGMDYKDTLFFFITIYDHLKNNHPELLDKIREEFTHKKRR